MKSDENPGKMFPVAEVVGAAAAVVLLLLQLLWAQEYKPVLRHAVQITFTVALTVSAAMLAARAVKKTEKAGDKAERH